MSQCGNVGVCENPLVVAGFGESQGRHNLRIVRRGAGLWATSCLGIYLRRASKPR